MWLIFLVVVALGSVILAVFFGKELLKKFQILRRFTHAAKDHVVTFNWVGASQARRKPGMHNIVLRSSCTGQPFSVLVGFELVLRSFRGLDPYGFAQSDERCVVVLSTYLGRGACTFVFLASREAGDIVASSTPEDQLMGPGARYEPHKFQTF